MLKKIEEKLAYQLLIKIMLVISVVLLLVGVSVALFMRYTSERELDRRLTVESVHVKNEVVTLFENAETYAKQLAFNTSIYDYLNDLKHIDDLGDHDKYLEVLDVMLAIDESSQNDFVAWIANEKASFYLTGEGLTPGPDYVIKDRPWYDASKFDQDIYYTPPYYDWGTKEVVLSAIKSLSLDEDDRGFVAIDFNLNILPSVIESINVGYEGEIFVVDGDGLYVYHPESSQILRGNIRDHMPEIKDQVYGGSEKDFQTVTLQGQAYYLKTLSIDKNQWQLVVLVKVSEVLSPLKDFLMTFGLLLFLLLFLLAVLMTKAIQAKLKPIEGLKKYGGLVAKGHLDKTPPYDYAKRRDEMGDLARSFVTITEVFKQKNTMLEDRVQSQQKEIQKQYHYMLEKEKMASIGTLVAGVAHEINTPLGVSITTGTYIEELANDLISHHKDKKLSKVFFKKHLASLYDASDLMMSNLKRAEGLVMQFKDMTRQESHEDLETFVLKDLVDQVVRNLKPAYKDRPIEIINMVDPDIEMTSIVRAMTQVITNLIMNSLHHGFEDQTPGKLIFLGGLNNHEVEFVYEDTGCGMSQETLDHIFEPFYTTKRNGNNSGLGMFIIHNLIYQNLRGSLTCQSRLGEGVVFKMTLAKTLDLKALEVRSTL